MRNTFVYWMYDATGRCLYVGVTRHPVRRWAQHQRSKPWISQVASKHMAGPFTDRVARAMERREQDALRPVYDARQSMSRTRLKSLERIRAAVSPAA